MKNKRLLSLLLAVVLLLVLVGCNKTAATPSTSPEASPSPTESAPAEIAWPEKPIQVIVSFGAGGDTDILCRKLCEEISNELGVPIVCTNVTGQSGTVAARQVKDSAADGYTVLWHQSSFFVASMTGIADFDYTAFELAGVAVKEVSDVVMVRKGAYKDINDFIEKAKANPKGLNYGTSLGGYSHLQALALGDAFGVEFNVVDIGGGSETIAALLAGDIDFVITTNNYARTYIESGDCEALCIMGNDPVAQTPDWPTLKDSGVTCDVTKIFGFYMPKGTDSAIVEKWEAAVEKAVNSDAYKEVCDSYAVTPAFTGGQDALTLHDEQYALISKYRDLMIKN